MMLPIAAAVVLALGLIALLAHTSRLLGAARRHAAEAEEARSALEREVAVRRHVEQVLRRDWELIRSIMETSPSAILMAGRDGSITFSNSRAARILELASGCAARLPIQQVLESGQPVEAYRCQIPREDGPTVVLSTSAVPLHDDTGRIEGVVATIEDVTGRVLAEQGLEPYGLHDPVTGLYARPAFQLLLGQALRRAARYPHARCAVLLLELERFPDLRDRLGPDAAGRWLAEIAARLRATARASDVIARLGDGRFAVLLDSLGTDEQAAPVAARIRDALAAPLRLDDADLSTPVRTGVSLSSAGHVEPDFMLAEARAALEHASSPAASAES